MPDLQPTPFRSVLVANRGEIACRVMRTVKSLGLEAIAVYSEADRHAPHVKIADQAVCIGPASVGESYLVGEKIIDAARITGAEAIHPGYGFLSENPEFAKACKDAGLIFIGPDPDAIELMGDKAKSKRRMIEAGVPCVPGYQGDLQDDAILIEQADKIGFPVMVKAAAGGGGRGMRLVDTPDKFPAAIKDARSEAVNAFGSDVLILERAIQKPRHVEIQVFADRNGLTLHFGERDCSVQRRHQKVLEEAPCPVMTPDLREAMGSAAVKAARDIGYVGAGTVEFMLESSGDFYFLEMNTRLQVEHPVTELVTGHDLVALQIKVAMGEPLGLTQEDISLSGHAIEARLYAEDPSAEFLPATGPIELWVPASGEGVRIDCGVETGGEVSPYYDPMIAKIMAYGATRDEARRRLVKAIRETAIMGVKTNKGFLIDALQNQIFVNGEATTAFIAEAFSEGDLKGVGLSRHDAAITAVLQYVLACDAVLAKTIDVECALLNWSSASRISTPYVYEPDEDRISLHVTPQSADRYSVVCGDETFDVSLLSRHNNKASMNVDGVRRSVRYFAKTDAHILIDIDGRNYDLVNQVGIMASAEMDVGGGSVVAPMHGALLEIFVKSGDDVKTGQRLAILEAMKMQHEILAEIDGTVTAIHVEAGDQIAAETIMIEIEEDAGQ